MFQIFGNLDISILYTYLSIQLSIMKMLIFSPSIFNAFFWNHPNIWLFLQTNSRFLSPLWAHEILESIHKHVCTLFPSWTGSCCLRGISHKWVACSRLSRGRRTKLGNTCRLPGPLASGKELRLDFHRHHPCNLFPLPRQALLLLRAFHPQCSFHLQVFLIENVAWWLWR